MTRLVLICSYLLLFFVPPVDALEEVSEGSTAPIEVSSDRLVAHDLQGTARFLGNVIVRRGDLSLYAPEVEIRYLSGTRDVDSVEAAGGVRIVQGETVSTADSALYDYRGEKVLLRGNARVFKAGDFIEGDEITVFLREEKSVVSGGAGSRVNAVFQSKGKTP